MTSPNDGQDLSRLDTCKHPAMPSRDLDAAVERYRKTAQAANMRELVAFLAEFRGRFEPCSEDERLEGYSTEGEFAAEAYREIFQDDIPILALSDSDLSFAEIAKTVYNRDSESFVDDFPDPITPPVSKELIAREVELVKNGVRAQCGDATLELPVDWPILLLLTNGIMSAGLPFRTGYIHHVYPVWTRVDENDRMQLDGHKVEMCATSSQLQDARRWSRYECLEVKAAFKIGGGSQVNEVQNATYRDTWYVYCRQTRLSPTSKSEGSDATTGPLVWCVIDRTDQHSESFADLKDYVDYWAEYIESTPGGENWFAA